MLFRSRIMAVTVCAMVLSGAIGSSIAAQGATSFSFTLPKEEQTPVPDTADDNGLIFPIICAAGSVLCIGMYKRVKR